MRLEVYFDYGSPYSYLAWHRITRMHPERYAGAEVLWKPVSVYHVLREDGTRPNAAYPNQGRYLARDLERWAAAYGLPYRLPDNFPCNSIAALRLHFLADQEGPAGEAAWMEAVFTAHWEEGRDLSDPAVLAELATRVGLPKGPEAADSEGLKRLLVANTQEAYQAGAPGVPYMVLDGEGYWGNDRLGWVEARLAGQERPTVL